MRHPRALVGVVAFVASAFGCGAFTDEPYLIDELQVVAIVAEPPEIYTGEITRLTAYVADPEHGAREVSIAWSYCPDRKTTESSRECGSDAVTLDTVEQTSLGRGILQTSTDHGIEPKAVSHVPSVILQAGFWEHVRLRAKSGGDEIEAFKRVVVIADGIVANANPVLEDVNVSTEGTRLMPVDEVDVGEGEGALPLYRIGAGDALTLVPRIAPEGFDAYRVLQTDGSWATRTEEPVLTWHVTGGQMEEWVTEDDAAVTWHVPEDEGRHHVFAVLRDGRGGTAVWAAAVDVE